MIANAVRKTLSASGTRLPSMLSTASAKAMSVATGTAQPPSAVLSPQFSATVIAAGTAMPPSAARPGAASRAGDASSLWVISRHSSSPTSRKNSAISPSLIQMCTGFAKSPMPSGNCSRAR